MKKLFKTFRTDKKYLIHILINVAFLFLFFYIGDYFKLIGTNPLQMFIFWAITLYLSDNITHKVVGGD